MSENTKTDKYLVPTHDRAESVESRENTVELFHYNDEKVQDVRHNVVKALGKDRKIVFIIGAGVSAAAGSKSLSLRIRSMVAVGLTVPVPTFLGSPPGTRALFTATMIRDDKTMAKHLAFLESFADVVADARPTKFHRMLNSLARDGHRIRIYTANIDCLEGRLPYLSSYRPGDPTPYPKVVSLHGRCDEMYCTLCGHTEPIDFNAFASKTYPPCPRCPDREITPHPQRTRDPQPKRAKSNVGCIAPHIQMYESEALPSLSFDDVRRYDVEVDPPDTVIVAGTQARVPGTVKLIRDLCNAAAACTPHPMRIWLNINELKDKTLLKCFDHMLCGECEDFVDIFYSTGA